MKDFNDKYLEPRIDNHATIVELNSQKASGEIRTSTSVTQLREFLTEILTILKNTELSQTENAKNIENDSLKMEAKNRELTPPQSLALQVRDRVCRLLELKKIEFAKIAMPLEKERNEEIWYIFTAVADELFLSRPWPGRSEFIIYLIEEKIFETSIAGQQIFDRIDHLLSSKSEQRDDLAELYLQALIIGFEGQYRGKESKEDIREYIRLLYVYLVKKEPGLNRSSSRIEGYDQIDSVHYERIISNFNPVKFFRLNKPVLISVLITILLLLFSQVVYLVITKPLREVLDVKKTVQIQKTLNYRLAILDLIEKNNSKTREL